MKTRARSSALLLVIVAVVLVVGLAAGWALTTVLRPAEDPLEATGFTFVTVENGEVGSSVTSNTVAVWAPEQAGTNQAAGIVTGVSVEAGTEVSQGAALYTVDLEPVVVAQGAIPAFRNISRGTSGDDVAQLQAMLAALGFYGGQIDGRAEAGTEAAITAWQKSLGVEQTGVVETGDVIFVPSLPSRVTLDTEVVTRGATLAGGEPVVQALPSSPTFTVPVTDAQAALMPTGTRVEITSPSGAVWEAYATDQTRDPQTQTVTVTLAGHDGASICGDACGEVPVTGQATLTSRIITVETVAGLVVPSAALVTTADGGAAVIDETGTQLPVSVTASARGMSVVEGVDRGLRVRVPAGGSGASS